MMPIRMGRKARTMEKVENLYRTARVQHVLPRGAGITRPRVDAQIDSILRDDAVTADPRRVNDADADRRQTA